MPLYRNLVMAPNVTGSTSWQDISGISPLPIQAGVTNYSFIATLSVSGLTIPQFPSGWQVVFRIFQGTTTLASHYMGDLNGGFQPSFTLTAVGDVGSTGRTENIHAKWIVSAGLKAYLREPISLSVIWDAREN